MIGKLLLIASSGLLPFYIDLEENISIDGMLLAGFCLAVNNVSRELSDEIDLILMKNNYKILFDEYEHKSGCKFLMAVICEKYHINQAVKNKMSFIFSKYLKDYDIPKNSTIDDETLEQNVIAILNDDDLRDMINDNSDLIIKNLGMILDNQENEIYAYALTSSTNNILFLDGTSKIMEHRPEKDLKSVIKEYLAVWDIKKIPQGDIWVGIELSEGLDLIDFCESNSKMLGLGINTSINSKVEPQNEVLLYLFGKNMLMRQVVNINGVPIEEILRDMIFTGIF